MKKKANSLCKKMKLLTAQKLVRAKKSLMQSARDAGTAALKSSKRRIKSFHINSE